MCCAANSKDNLNNDIADYRGPTGSHTRKKNKNLTPLNNYEIGTKKSNE